MATKAIRDLKGRPERGRGKFVNIECFLGLLLKALGLLALPAIFLHIKGASIDSPKLMQQPSPTQGQAFLEGCIGESHAKQSTMHCLILAAALAVGVWAYLHHCDALRRLERVVSSFGSFIPKSLVNDIAIGRRGSSNPLARIHARRVSIMFSDIADFTTTAESISDRDLLLLLTSYFHVMTSIAEMCDGEVAEILGDGLVIFWNATDDVEDHAAKACLAALAMQTAIPLLNETLVAEGLPRLSIRIGIHTGNVLTGIIGSQHRLKFGCMGDAVNLTSRLEGLCKHFDVGILCSSDIIDDAGQGFVFRKLGLVQVKGRDKCTAVYELMCSVGNEEEAQSGGESFQEALLNHDIDQGSNATGQAQAARDKSMCFRLALDAFEVGTISQALQQVVAFLESYPGDGPAARLQMAIQAAEAGGACCSDHLVGGPRAMKFDVK
eukprot:TRINITY_DN28831_c0_g1_i1.p1 TRINITY_DN28831_c0_g1~~TRINITY_DN28831_c0_g1_i1.p1  ORF type:complete len:499 (+),score=90.15 TRINITY_DN28831_c0_g1_i1:184-1497(+)